MERVKKQVENVSNNAKAAKAVKAASDYCSKNSRVGEDYEFQHCKAKSHYKIA